MLLPDYLFHVADKAVELWERINVYAVKEIARRVADAQDHMTGTVEWQKYKIEQSGMTAEAVRKAVQKINGYSDAEVRRIFEEAVVKSHINDADIYEKAGIKPAPFGTAQARKNLQVYYEQTRGELNNFTRTAVGTAQKAYINACDSAFLVIQSGLESPSTAIRKAIDDAAKEGLRVTYPGGHTDTVEVAVRRAVTTGVNRAALQMTVDECEREGTNFVIVSSHLGARVSDTNPIANHAGWQGQIYRLKDRRAGFWGALEKFSDWMHGTAKYPLLRDATGFPDDPLGLGGYNCRHSMYPYIPGVTQNHMTQFDSEENRRVYKASQEQRAMERRMRETKRRYHAAEAARAVTGGQTAQELDNDATNLKRLFERQYRAYSEYCRENGLAEQMDRTYIAK